MRINDNAKKCVAFLQYKMDDGSFKYAGTCFFVGFEYKKNVYGYVVTAKHVLEQITKNFGLNQIFIKINLKNGKAETICTDICTWIHHQDENVDIAIRSFVLDANKHDHLYYPDDSCLTEHLINKYGISCGDEVFIAGLFKHHTGETKNSPIIRIGNIALIPSEKIQAREKKVDAYLIESRSIGGLSGSPVFFNPGDMRRFGDEMKYAQGEHIPLLLGIVFGHFDSEKSKVDGISDKTIDQERINVGIAIVMTV